MAATQVVGTPAPAPKAAPAPTPAEPSPVAEGGSEGGGLNALLETVTPDEVEGAEEESDSAAAESSAEASPGEAQAEAEPKKSQLETATSAEELFTEDALASPEGVTRARDVLRAAKKELNHRQAKLDRYELRLEARAKKEAGARDQQRTTLERVGAIGAALEREVHAVRSAPSARERLAALGRIAGVDGQQLFEELSLGVAQDGPAAAPSPAEVALQQRLDRLEKTRELDREAAGEAEVAGRARALERGIEQKMTEIAADCSNIEVYPVLAGKIQEGAFDASEAATFVADYMAAHYGRTKKSLARAEAIAILEARLVKATGQARRAEQSSERSSGTLPKVPSSPARSAGSRGVTVTPTIADRSAGKGRKLNERERIDEAARDPEFMAQLFGTHSR